MRLVLPHIHYPWISLISPIIHQLIGGADEEEAPPPREAKRMASWCWHKANPLAKAKQRKDHSVTGSKYFRLYSAPSAKYNPPSVPLMIISGVSAVDLKGNYRQQQFLYNSLSTTIAHAKKIIKNEEEFLVIGPKHSCLIFKKWKMTTEDITLFKKSSIQANNSPATYSSTSSPQSKMLHYFLDKATTSLSISPSSYRQHT